MSQNHCFVTQNRNTNLFQRTYVKDKAPYITIINQEIENITIKYPLFRVTMSVDLMDVKLTYNNYRIYRELVDNIKGKFFDLTDDEVYITISM